MLQRGDWAGLRQLFAAREPQDALEYQARAILAFNGGGQVDWAGVLADLRKACSLRPSDALIRANLVQALLDAQRPAEAYEEARTAAAMAPSALPALEKLGLAAAATGRWDEALDALGRGAKLLKPGERPPQAAARLFAELRTQWWKPLSAGTTRLRKPGANDAAFLRDVFGDAAFMRHFHRFQPAGARAVQHFIDVAGQAPMRSRRIDWIVEHRGLDCGLAALVDMDFPNRRAELLVGFPRAPSPQAALEASFAVMDFAFNRLRLEKLVSYVYGDNPAAQANTLHLGFRQEGLLRSHIHTAGGRLDLFVNGMLRPDFASNPLLRRLAARWRRDDATPILD